MKSLFETTVKIKLPLLIKHQKKEKVNSFVHFLKKRQEKNKGKTETPLPEINCHSFHMDDQLYSIVYHGDKSVPVSDFAVLFVYSFSEQYKNKARKLMKFTDEDMRKTPPETFVEFKMPFYEIGNARHFQYRNFVLNCINKMDENKGIYKIYSSPLDVKAKSDESFYVVSKNMSTFGVEENPENIQSFLLWHLLRTINNPMEYLKALEKKMDLQWKKYGVLGTSNSQDAYQKAEQFELMWDFFKKNNRASQQIEPKKTNKLL